MTDEYTPTVAWAARMYAFGSVTDGAGIEISDVEVSKRAEFDRMIAGVERAAAVKALRDAESIALSRAEGLAGCGKPDECKVKSEGAFLAADDIRYQRVFLESGEQA